MSRGYSAPEIFKSNGKAFLLSLKGAEYSNSKYLGRWECFCAGLHGLEASPSDCTVSPSLRNHPPYLDLCLFTYKSAHVFWIVPCGLM